MIDLSYWLDERCSLEDGPLNIHLWETTLVTPIGVGSSARCGLHHPLGWDYELCEKEEVN